MMTRAGDPSEHASDVGEHADREGVGRERSKRPKAYVVTIEGLVPKKLAELISAIHAVAIRQGEEHSGRSLSDKNS